MDEFDEFAAPPAHNAPPKKRRRRGAGGGRGISIPKGSMKPQVRPDSFAVAAAVNTTGSATKKRRRPVQSGSERPPIPQSPPSKPNPPSTKPYPSTTETTQPSAPSVPPLDLPLQSPSNEIRLSPQQQGAQSPPPPSSGVTVVNTTNDGSTLVLSPSVPRESSPLLALHMRSVAPKLRTRDLRQRQSPLRWTESSLMLGRCTPDTSSNWHSTSSVNGEAGRRAQGDLPRARSLMSL